MAWNIKGSTVTLHVKTKIGEDAFNAPVYADSIVTVENVLIGRPETQDEARALDLYGKRLAYTLGIPKGDAHDWTDTKVEFFGRVFRTFGLPMEAEPDNIPGPWGKKVMVELYE